MCLVEWGILNMSCGMGHFECLSCVGDFEYASCGWDFLICIMLGGGF